MVLRLSWNICEAGPETREQASWPSPSPGRRGRVAALLPPAHKMSLWASCGVEKRRAAASVLSVLFSSCAARASKQLQGLPVCLSPVSLPGLLVATGRSPPLLARSCLAGGQWARRQARRRAAAAPPGAWWPRLCCCGGVGCEQSPLRRERGRCV